MSVAEAEAEYRRLDAIRAEAERAMLAAWHRWQELKQEAARKP